MTPLRPEWQLVHEQIVLYGCAEGTDDVFETHVTTKSLEVALGLRVRSTDIEIEHKTVVESQSLTGLRFTLTNFRDKWCIKASLPKRERPVDVREHFARLRRRVFYLLEIYEDKASASASSTTRTRVP